MAADEAGDELGLETAETCDRLRALEAAEAGDRLRALETGERPGVLATGGEGLDLIPGKIPAEC